LLLLLCTLLHTTDVTARALNTTTDRYVRAVQPAPPHRASHHLG
jgi:hypothetical protein